MNGSKQKNISSLCRYLTTDVFKGFQNRYVTIGEDHFSSGEQHLFFFFFVKLNFFKLAICVLLNSQFWGKVKREEKKFKIMKAIDFLIYKYILKMKFLC